MPVGGYSHKRVWQYRFLPRPVSLLDRGWGDDRQWAHDVVERLRRGEAAPRSLPIDELIRSEGSAPMSPGGWEQAEEWARNAIRGNSSFLTDEAIARRLPDRERRKKAWAEEQGKWRAYWEAGRADREAKEAAEREARRAWEKKQEAAAERLARREAAWKEAEAEAEKRAGPARAALRAEFVADREDLAARAERRQQERRLIEAHHWQCSRCGKLATVDAKASEINEGRYVYLLKCGCAERYWTHAGLLRMMAETSGAAG